MVLLFYRLENKSHTSLKYSKISALPYFIPANLTVSPLFCYTKMLIIMVGVGGFNFIKNIVAFNLYSSMSRAYHPHFAEEQTKVQSSELGR